MQDFKIVLAFLFLALTSLASGASTIGGGLTSYSQDFESLDSGGVYIGDGWRYFINVFENDTHLFGYFGMAPNGPQISALTTQQGGVAQGEFTLAVYSDYECCEPASGHRSPTGLGVVETNVYQEQIIDSSNTGEQWTFSFDAKQGNVEGSSTTLAFLKVLDPANGFSLTDEITLETTYLSTNWARYSISLTIGDWAGQFLQFGFQSSAGNFEGAAIFYDNTDFNVTSVPLPGAFLFLVSGLLGVVGWRR